MIAAILCIGKYVLAIIALFKTSIWVFKFATQVWIKAQLVIVNTSLVAQKYDTVILVIGLLMIQAGYLKGVMSFKPYWQQMSYYFNTIKYNFKYAFNIKYNVSGNHD